MFLKLLHRELEEKQKEAKMDMIINNRNTHTPVHVYKVIYSAIVRACCNLLFSQEESLVAGHYYSYKELD